MGSLRLDLEITRRGGDLAIQARSAEPAQFCLSPGLPVPPCTGTDARVHELRVPVRPVEIYVPAQLPEPGSRTHGLKAIDERYLSSSASFTFSAPGGERYELPVRFNRAGITVEGATISAGKLLLQMPAGSDYQTQTVTFRW